METSYLAALTGLLQCALLSSVEMRNDGCSSCPTTLFKALSQQNVTHFTDDVCGVLDGSGRGLFWGAAV